MGHMDLGAGLSTISARIDRRIGDRISTTAWIVAGPFGAHQEAEVKTSYVRLLNIAGCVSIARAIVGLIALNRREHDLWWRATTVCSRHHRIDPHQLVIRRPQF